MYRRFIPFLMAAVMGCVLFLPASPLTAEDPTIQDFQNKRKWTHLKDKDEVHTLEDAQGVTVPWGVTRFYRQRRTDKKSVYGIEILVFWKGKGRGIPVYQQWGAPHKPFQRIPRGKRIGDGWILPIPGARKEYVVRVADGRMTHFIILVYRGDAERPAAHFSLSDPVDPEETPEMPVFPSISLNKKKWI